MDRNGRRGQSSIYLLRSLFLQAVFNYFICNFYVN